MPAGFQAFLPDGRLVIDVTSRLVKFRAAGTYTVPAATRGPISLGYPGADAQKFLVSGYTTGGLYSVVSSWVTANALNFQKDTFAAGEVIHYFIYVF
ncbi:hypothetical protein CTYAZ2_12500 [Comamonas testosteroni]|nr:hypothetical protein CTYAZ2_12500 [Comamonas testosteroni]